MREFLSISALCAALCACSPSSQSPFLTDAIGTNVYSEDAAVSAQSELNYSGYICQLAGLPVAGAEGAPRCDFSDVNSDAWALFVQAGMNDIDRRCDAYLAWLDERKRSTPGILKEFSDLGVAATTVMGVTKVGTGPIQLAAIAVGLAASSFTNINSRLIYEINSATIQSYVLARQTNFRMTIKGAVINNRPAAIYVLRSYLRICMPATIETEVNATVTLFERGGSAALDKGNAVIGAGGARSVRKSAPVAEYLRDLPQTRVDQPLPPAPTRVASLPPEGAITLAEKQLTPRSLRSLQAAVCLKDPSGKFDDATRAAFDQYLRGRQKRGPDAPAGPFTRDDLNALQEAKCSPEFNNAFEIGWFTPPPGVTVADFTAHFLGRLAKAPDVVPAGQTLQSLDATARQAIANYRHLVDKQLADPTANESLDQTLAICIQRIKDATNFACK
ncbi:MAG: hypothetical protein KGM15_00080 [Pseudomonadota bacterium]|nr:hypothetical protein [Pseudomonadota bacterium]